MKVFIYTKHKNQKQYIPEWIEHYKKLGFDGAIIHDNSTKNDNKYVNPFIEYIDKLGQQWIYQKPDTPLPHYNTSQTHWSNEVLGILLSRYPSEECWMFNIDLDEYLDESIGNIKSYIKSFNNVWQHFFWWEYYDDNNIIENSTYTIKLFTHKSRTLPDEYIKNGIPGQLIHFFEGKSLVEVHHCGYWVCVHGTKQVFNELEIETKYRLKHYYTKSLSEWFDVKLSTTMTGNEAHYPDVIMLYFKYNKITLEKINYVLNRILNYNLTNNDKQFILYLSLLKLLYEKGDTDIFCTYHNDLILNDYLLQSTKYFHLFGTHLKNNYDMDGMGPYFNEYCTMYYVYKNPHLIKHKFVGFCHYRRMFDKLLLTKENQMQVYEVVYSVLNTYKQEVGTINGHNTINEGIRLLGKDFIEFLVNTDSVKKFCKEFFINDRKERAYPYKEIFIMSKKNFINMMNEINPVLHMFLKYINLSYIKIKGGTLEKRYGKMVGNDIARRLIGYLIELYIIRTWLSYNFDKDNVLI